jgi:hypothetical protein
MDNEEIRSFINDLIYDLETIRYLQEYARNKETLPIVDLVCDRIELFKRRINESPYLLKGLFEQDFWERQVSSDLKASDLRLKISGLSKEWGRVHNDDLKKLHYERFILLLESWILKNVRLLKKRTRSDLQKKIETISIGVLGLLIFTGLLWCIIFNFMTHDWGLKGDFYAGENFEKYLCTGYAKTINFHSPEEMNAHIPHDYYSVRWRGSLLAPQDGEYVISVLVDDGVKLFIDGRLLIDATCKKGSKEVFLSKGPHKITLEYYQITCGATLVLSWSIDKGKEEVIPAKYLRRL